MRIWTCSFVVVMVIGGCSRTCSEATEVESNARRTAKGVVDISDVHHGASGQPVLVVQQRHNSILSGLQEAVFLERMRKSSSLSAIGLEGLLLEESESLEAHEATSPERFVRLLEQGALSSAEFMRLTTKTPVYALERREDFRRAAVSEAQSGVALRKVRPEDAEFLAEIMNTCVGDAVAS